jgi:hypothetical protein
VRAEDRAGRVVVSIPHRGDDKRSLMARAGAREKPLQLVGSSAVKNARFEGRRAVTGFRPQPAGIGAMLLPFDPRMDEHGPPPVSRRPCRVPCVGARHRVHEILLRGCPLPDMNRYETRHQGSSAHPITIAAAGSLEPPQLRTSSRSMLLAALTVSATGGKRPIRAPVGWTAHCGRQRGGYGDFVRVKYAITTPAIAITTPASVAMRIQTSTRLKARQRRAIRRG